jgi:putative peptidoglycan lipid II flippase
VLGLVRNALFAAVIPKPELSVYVAAFQIPDFLFNVLILGAISTAFVPILTGELKKRDEGDSESWQQLANQVLTWMIVAMIALGAIAAIFMPWLTRIVVPGFVDNPAQFNLTVQISRILLVQSVLFAISFIMGGVLTSFKRFGAYALAPILYNLFLIAGGIIAAYHGIHLLAWMVVVGSAVHAGIQAWEAYRAGYIPRLTLKVSKKLREVLTLMIPRSISLAGAQLMGLVFIAVASTLRDASSIPMFKYLNDLQTAPTAILANTLAVAAFPSLAHAMAAQDWGRMNDILKKAVRISLFLLIPSVVAGLVLRAQIVRLYFGLGGPEWSVTIAAIDTFTWFMVGVIPTGLIAVFARALYAHRETWKPLLMSAIAGFCGLIVAFIGIFWLNGNVSTLAAAASCISIVQCALFLYLLLKQKSVSLNMKSLALCSLHYSIAAAIAAIAAWLTLRVIDATYTSFTILGTNTVIGLLLQLLMATAVFGLVYYAYSKRYSRSELTWLLTRKIENGA